MTVAGLLLDGAWTSRKDSVRHTVRSPYSGDDLGEIVLAGPTDTEAALESAVAGATLWRNTLLTSAPRSCSKPQPLLMSESNLTRSP